MLSASEILKLDQSGLENLCDKFFNDTFLVDQNACSSPGLIFWVGADKTRDAAKHLFWTSFSKRLDENTNGARQDDGQALDVMAMAAQLGRPISSRDLGDVIWRFDDSTLALASFALAIFSNSTSTIWPNQRPP